ncbi:MAG: tetraacyldisaccharide 4'-kinase [Cyclobacteriaceae bacterium]
MYWWQYILFPFALIFHLITWIRNRLFDQKLYKSVAFDTNVILVGNLSIGGTGKTPMIDYFIRYFDRREIQCGMMSRGYGRKTHGFRLAGKLESAETIGDEPFMYHHKYEGRIPVAVGEDRMLAITEYLSLRPELDVILMDDGFQHRTVAPSVSLLLTTYNNPFTADFMLPAGRLRESRDGAERANFIIVTKCPDHMSDSEMVVYRHRISKYTDAKVFFMKTVYEEIKPIFDDVPPLTRQIVAISGMANSQPFESYLRSKFSVKLVHNYRDHYRYKEQDVRDIIRELKPGISLVCTEKDKVKLQQFEELRKYPCYYLPISMEFLRDEGLFQNSLESYLNYTNKDGND